MNAITITLDGNGKVRDVQTEGMGTVIRVLGPGGKLISEKQVEMAQGRIDIARVAPFEYYFKDGRYCVEGPEGVEEFEELADASDKFREYIGQMEGEDEDQD